MRQHRKTSSANPIMTARTRKASNSKEKEMREATSRVQKRASFKSPGRSSEARADDLQGYSLLNYLILVEKHTKELQLTRDAFEVKQTLGKGGFGKVYLTQQKKTKAYYAMKEMSKSLIITKHSIDSVLNQRKLLQQLKHPYLVNMVYAFQDRVNLYLILEYMPGGDLRYQIGRFQTFPQHIVKFFICCILLALQFLHLNHVIHRDLKPQNLIFDGKGYLRLTDLGVARVHSAHNAKDTSGTPGYMAPEVINHMDHSYPVDFFALGVITYECTLGRRPFKGFNRRDIREQILAREVVLRQSELPPNWSPHAASFATELLCRNPAKRLGSKGIHQIMGHPWLADIDWTKMKAKKYPSPFMPNFSHRNYDTISQSEYDQNTLQLLAENSLLLCDPQYQRFFQDYQYKEVKF